MSTLSDIKGSYRLTVQSGLTTTVAAATATAGHIFSMRHVNTATGAAMLLRAFEIEAITTTAFGTPQEVGFDLVIARSFSASPTGATAVTLATGNGKKFTTHPDSAFVTTGDIRVANTGAMTAGTQTLDGQGMVQGSFWSSAIGAQMAARRYDFTDTPPGGILLKTSEGFIVRNSILMGATGVVRWTFTAIWDEVIVVSA